MLTHQRLLQLLKYDCSSGIFTWAVAKQRCPIGKVAGTAHSGGYVSIKIDQKRYFAHRLAWFYVTGSWPSQQIDHIDLDKKNNSFANLREASAQQNSCNTPTRSKSGLKGVTQTRGKFVARIQCSSQPLHIGTFLTKEKAHAAYAAEAARLFGAFARTV